MKFKQKHTFYATSYGSEDCDFCIKEVKKKHLYCLYLHLKIDFVIYYEQNSLDTGNKGSL